MDTEIVNDKVIKEVRVQIFCIIILNVYPYFSILYYYYFQIPVYLSNDLRHLILLHYPTRLTKNDQLLSSIVTQVSS